MSWIVSFIVLPLFTAFFLLFMSQWIKKIASYLALLVSGGLGLWAFALLPKVVSDPIAVILGGWNPPFGINLYIDPLSLGMVMVVSGMIALGIMFQITDGRKKPPYFYGLMLLLLGSLNGMLLTGDAFNFFVFMEISGMATYGLIAKSENKAASRGALKYLILAGAASVFFLIGIALLYRGLGTLNMAHLSETVVKLANGVVLVAYVSFLVPLLLESEAFPFNAWVPDAYKGAPSMISGLLSSAVGVVSVYALIRFSYFIFGVNYFDKIVGGLKVSHILLGIGVLTAVAGEIAALHQKDVKKLLAYSSVGQMGLIITALSLTDYLALHAALFLVISHAVAKMLLFLSTGVIIRATGTSNWQNWRGIGRKNPLIAVFMLVGILALLGVPLFSGFWGKLELVTSATMHGLISFWAILVVLGGSVIEAGYFFRLLHTMFEESEKEVKIHGGLGYWLSSVALVISIMVMGVYPKPFSSFFKHSINSQHNYSKVMKKYLSNTDTLKRVR